MELLIASVFLWQNLFVHQQKHIQFRLYMVLELILSGCVGDPVVIAEVSQIKGVGSNPVVHTTGTRHGVVNLSLFHPKLLCEPPPPPQGIRQVGGWL